MKKLIILSTIGLFLTFQVEAKRIKGQIFFDHDTIEVTMNIPVKFFSQVPNYEKLQYKVKYFDDQGVKKVLRPDDAKEIRFTYGNKEVRMLSRYNSLGGNIFSLSSNIFLRIESDGYLKLFNFYFTRSSPGMYNASTGMTTGGYAYSVEKFVLQKGSGQLKRPSGLTFRKDMMQYFNDCPALVQKIENREFRKGDIQAIVRFYNQNCN